MGSGPWLLLDAIDDRVKHFDLTAVVRLQKYPPQRGLGEILDGPGIVQKDAFLDRRGQAQQANHLTNAGPTHAYWARGEGIGSYTEYEYDGVTGDLLEVGYGPSTPGMSFTYDRLGRVKTATDLDYTVHTFAYSGVQLTSETVDGSSLSGPELDYVLTPTYQTSTNASNGLLTGRSASLGVGPSSGNSTGWYNTTYGYDSLGRIQSVTGPGLPSGGKAEYGRIVNGSGQPVSDLIAKVEIKDSGGDVIASTIKSYETQRDLIASVENVSGSIGVPPVSTISKYEYQNDSLARRTSVVRTGSAFSGGTGDHQELYTYNARNELKDAHTYAGSDLQNPGSETVSRRRVYDYDPIGNRLTHANGNDDATSYTSNNLNQYTEICPPPLPPVCEEPTYDADGNLKSDANWNYYWDLENRLSFVVAKTPGEGAKYYQYDYDYMNRRIRKRTFEWVCPEPREGCVCGVYSGSCEVGQWNTTPSQDIRYVYDGWNLLMEIDALDSNAILRKYTWGLDLSGTRQRAGGIGGLLAVEGSASVPPAKYLYFNDANGNVTQLIDLADGSIAARYEYDPYGNTVASSGAYADANQYRFSTKFFDAETGQYYYGRRFYLSQWGRWSNRDPIEEQDGSNLYGFVHNNPNEAFDSIGLFSSRYHIEITSQGNIISGCPLKSDFLELIAHQNVVTDYPGVHLTDFAYHAQSDGFVPLLRDHLRAIRSKHCICQPYNYAPLIVLIGEALHGIQDFYSHTDWVEGWNMQVVYANQSTSPFSFIPDFLYQNLTTHGPYYPRIFDIARIEQGDGSELGGVLVYKGGFAKGTLWTASFDLDRHQAYAADEPSNSLYRTRWPGNGLGPTAFTRAHDSAVDATAAFFRWLYNAVPDCRGLLFQ